MVMHLKSTHCTPRENGVGPGDELPVDEGLQDLCRDDRHHSLGREILNVP